MPNRKTLPTDTLEQLPPHARATVLRLLSVAGANGANLPQGVLDEIEAISIEGADPEWQVQQLQEILDRCGQNH